MLQIRCTKKVLDLFSYKAESMSEIKSADSLFGNWYVNELKVERRKVLLFTSELTLLSFVYFGVRKSTVKDLEVRTVNGIVRLLDTEGFTGQEIGRVIDDYRVVSITKTENRKTLGNMNDLAFLYESHIHSSGGLQNCNIEEIQKRVNRTPQRNLEWTYSINEAEKVIRGASNKKT